MFLGAHMPVAGGLHKAFERIRSIDGTAMQIFTRNQRRWESPDLTAEEIELFRAGWREWGDYPIAAHDSYLVNLASPDAVIAAKSLKGFAAELDRAERLGIKWLVTHPGSHMGRGVEAGIERYVMNLDRAVEMSGTGKVIILLENTAGQGTNLGSRFEELARVIEKSAHAGRIGVCFDTCHGFGAGYDIRDSPSYEKVFSDFDAIIGFERLRFFHLNDSKRELGSHRDRHEHIGRGEIGLAGFRLIMRDERFSEIPKVLETPKGPDLAEDRDNLAILRGL